MISPLKMTPGVEQVLPRVHARTRASLKRLSLDLHKHPELAFHETRAVARITRWLEARGCQVTTGIGGLPTAFRTDVGSRVGPSIVLIAEYDALPGLGHACGHNLIAASMLAAFDASRAYVEGTGLRLSLIGTPAEEDGGGKVQLITAGVFDDARAVLSTHAAPEAVWSAGATNLGNLGRRIVFTGVASHAASAPTHGVSALSAALLMLHGVDAWRLHLSDGSRVHGIILDGGRAVNAIPDRSEAVFALRSPDLQGLRTMEARLVQIGRGAALMTGTSMEVSESMPLYEPMQADTTLTRLLNQGLALAGLAIREEHHVLASTDLGNVSHVAPTSWVRFPITPHPIAGHSIEMREASATTLAHQNAFAAAEIVGGAVLSYAAGHAEA